MPAGNAPPSPLQAPAAAPPIAAGAGGSDASLDAEAAQFEADLLSQTGGGAGENMKAFSPSLRFYGFADFTIQKWIALSTFGKGYINDHLSFGVSHINLYAEGDIAPNWKSMAEVRFLFQPSGAAGNPTAAQLANPLANSGRTNSATSDFNDTNRLVNLGGLAIQRAYIEYTASPYLKIRAGRFLTPWGIWNVDHGSPVIIGPNKPYIVGEQFFPEAQTGFEVLGTAPVGDATIGYHLTLSNGRGPADAYEDLDGNKAIGGRVFLRGYWLGQADIGVSAYGGTVTDRRQQIGDLKTQSVEYFNYSHYREVSWAADLRWLWKGLHFQNEAAVHDRAWSDDARPPVVAMNGQQADVRRFSMYSLLGYRLPWFNIMPYTIISYYDAGERSAFVGASKLMGYAVGLNVRVQPSVVLKSEVSMGHFISPNAGSVAASDSDIGVWLSQLAWAF
ncbi:MAG: hypothetical protein ABI560_07100 [Myxococcales bacterium]